MSLRVGPKELSKEIFLEEALIEEGVRIDKNIAAVFPKTNVRHWR